MSSIHIMEPITESYGDNQWLSGSNIKNTNHKGNQDATVTILYWKQT